MITKVYHTLRHSDNPDEILEIAPVYCCDRPGELKEWLGDGYYFWEDSEELAHWWGKVRYIGKREHYIICATTFDCPDEKLLDLVNNMTQIRDMREVVEYMRSIDEFRGRKLTAQMVFHYLRTRIDFPYLAIRAHSHDCCNEYQVKKFKLKFSNSSYLHLCPEIQICVIDKSVLKLPMQIVYSSKCGGMLNYTV